MKKRAWIPVLAVLGLFAGWVSTAAASQNAGQGKHGGTTTTSSSTSTSTSTSTTTSTTSTTVPTSTCTPGSPEANTPSNGFTCPVQIPGSTGLGEPTIIADNGAGNGGVQRLFVTGPQGIGNINSAGGSPLYTSTNGGSTWSAPVRAQTCAGLSGGDTDLAVDASNDIYQSDLWLANSCLSVSVNHGSSFEAGNPFGQELQPGDDRPWLAYDGTITNGGELFGTYDGVDALHIVNTGPLANPAVGIQAISDNVVIPESAVSSSGTPSSVRACVCPPGGVAVDQSAGTHRGRVYVSFSDQLGTGIASADPNALGTTPTGTWSYSFVNDSSQSGSAFQDEWNFTPIAVDSNGVVYVMWGHATTFDASSNLAGAGGVQEYYAYSTDGGKTFSTPVRLSTEPGTTTFPTMHVVSPGVIDAAWYGTSATGDPNTVPSSSQWNVYYTRVTGANTSSPSIAPKIAVSDIHNGCIQTGGGGSCSDRSLLDFFTLIDTNGQPDIIYAAGDANHTPSLYFTKLP